MFIVMLLLFVIACVGVLGYTHTLNLNWSNGGTNPLNTTVTVTGTAEFNTQTTAPISATTLMEMAFLYANLQSIYVLSPFALTLNTNATDGTGGNSIPIAANQPFIWYLASGVTCPFTNNVTKFYWVNASGTNVPTVQVRVLHNA